MREEVWVGEMCMGPVRFLLDSSMRVEFAEGAIIVL